MSGRPFRTKAARLTERWATVLDDYEADLAGSDLSENSRRGYASRIAGYLSWLAVGQDRTTDGDPLADPCARDHAVRAYLSQLRTDRNATAGTVNAHLTALGHFYHHLGLGASLIKRERVFASAPQALEEPDRRRFILAAASCGSTRNTALGLLLLYTGLRVEEVEALDIDDVVIAAHHGRVVVRGNSEICREIPLHRVARRAMRAWLDQRLEHRNGDQTMALFLSRRRVRLRVRAIYHIVAKLGVAAGLTDDAGKSIVQPYTLRHTFATQLVRNGVDVDNIADLMGTPPRTRRPGPPKRTASA
jgi:site-specific recombinase XerD